MKPTSPAEALRLISSHLRRYREDVLRLTQPQMVERIKHTYGRMLTRQTYAAFEAGASTARADLVFIALAELGTLEEVLKVAEPDVVLFREWVQGIPGYGNE